MNGGHVGVWCPAAVLRTSGPATPVVLPSSMLLGTNQGSALATDGEAGQQDLGRSTLHQAGSVPQDTLDAVEHLGWNERRMGPVVNLAAHSTHRDQLVQSIVITASTSS